MSATLRATAAKTKLEYNKDTRKVGYVQSFSELHDMISQLYNLKPGSFIIKYKDEDDFINVDNQEGYLMAMQDFDESKNLAPKFYVYDSNESDSFDDKNSKFWDP